MAKLYVFWINRYLKQYVRVKLIVYFENKLVLWKSAREVTPITTAQTK